VRLVGNEAAGGWAHGATEIRVRVADTDLLGVAYHSHYLVWFEIGRTELMRSRGISYAEVERRGYSLPVTEAALKIRLPARYDETIRVETRIEQVLSRKVVFSYRILRDADLLVEGSSTHLSVRHEDARAVPIPDWLKDPLLGA
jgi:acyl-CoA thioester hydrolase